MNESLLLALAARNKGGGTGGSVQSDWNQNDSSAADFIKNKPFYEETTEVYGDTLTWDGDTTGREMIEQVPNKVPEHLYKVSDQYIPASAIVNATLTSSSLGEIPVFTLDAMPGDEESYDCVVAAADIEYFGLEPGVTLFQITGIDSSMRFAVISANAPRVVEGLLDIPSAGTYFADMTGVDLYPTGEIVGFFTSLTIPGYGEFLSKQTTIHKLDKKYLPDGIGGNMFINITIDDNDEYVADKTYDEISEAIESGIIPYCICYGTLFNLSTSGSLNGIETYSAIPEHRFSNLFVKGTGNTMVSGISIGANDTVYFAEYSLTVTAVT